MNRIDLPAVARAVPRLPALLLLLSCATAAPAQRPQPLHDLRAADDRDADGRVGLRAEPDWLLEQAMATYAFWELLFDAPDAKTHERAIATLDALVRELERARPAPDLEVQLWCRFVFGRLAARLVLPMRRGPDSQAMLACRQAASSRAIQTGRAITTRFAFIRPNAKSGYAGWRHRVPVAAASLRPRLSPACRRSARKSW